MKWSVPVVFVDRDTGERRSVSSAAEAIQFLDRWWKKEDGDPFYTAIVTCIDATRQDALAENARLAFLTALHAGGVRVLPAVVP